MFPVKKSVGLAIITAAIFLFSPFQALSESSRIINIGYFEGGASSYHSLIRTEIKRLLDHRAGDSLIFRFVPYGFGSAEWNRDSCRALAGVLAAEPKIDLFITAGPWVVEDLLAAGCRKPIIATHRLDPMIEGLLDQNSRPTASNVTVHYRPEKITTDLNKMVELLGVRKIGFLFFPSDDESVRLFESAKNSAAVIGVELVTAEQFDDAGNYAYFKSYNGIKAQRPEAMYLGPLWGLDNIQAVEFWSMLARDRMPAFSWEGDIPVQRGALGTAAGLSFIGEANAAVTKIIKILSGASPADLPSSFPQQPLLVINQSTADSCHVRLPRFLLLDAQLVGTTNPGESENISLAQALERALSSHPAQLAAEDILQIARQEYRAVKAGYLPQLSAGASAFHQDDNGVSNSHNWIEPDGYSLSIALEQTILSLEKLSSLKAAAAGQEVARSELLQSTMALEQSVSAAYLGFLQTYEELRIIRKDREHIRIYQEIARSRTMEHPEDSAQIIYWERQWQAATRRHVSAEYNVRAARSVLTALMNLPENYPFAVDTVSFSDEKMFNTLRRLYTVGENESMQERLRQAMVSTALNGDPRLVTYKSRVDFQRKILSAKSAASFPTLKLRANYRLADSLQNDIPTFEEQSNSWSVAGILEFPIWLGGKGTAEKNRTKAKISAMEYATDSVSLITMNEVSEALFEMLSYSEQMPVVFRQRRAARQILESAASGYEDGKVSVVELTDAQSGVADAELRMISIRYGFFNSMSKLAKVMGWNSGEYSSFDTAFMTWLTNYYASIKDTTDSESP